MKKLVGAMVLAAAVIGSGVALAHGPWGPGYGSTAGSGAGPGYGCQGQGPGGAGCPATGAGPGVGGRMGPGLRGLATLDLTDAQREQLATLRFEFAKEMQALRNEHRERIEAILTPEQRERLGSFPGR